jgi:DNA-binding protein H-NS
MTMQPTISNGKPSPPARGNGTAEGDARPAPALPLDITTLTDDVLAALTAAAQRETEERLQRRRDTALAALKEQAEAAQALGIPLARLKAFLEGKDDGAKEKPVDGRSTVAPKFWNLKDHTQRWSGRGNPPRWMADHLAAGGAEDECLIPEGALSGERSMR